MDLKYVINILLFRHAFPLAKYFSGIWGRPQKTSNPMYPFITHSNLIDAF